MSIIVRKTIGIFIVVLGTVLLLVHFLKMPHKDISQVELDRFLQNHSIESARVTPTPYTGIYMIEGTSMMGNQHGTFSITTHMEQAQMRALLENPAVTIDVPGSGMRGMLGGLVPVLVIGVLITGVVIYQMSVGKSHKNHKVKVRPTARFSDVAGVEEAKNEVLEVVDFLKHPKKYRKLGGKLPKGILLIGPPGTGKTLLAKAIAGEAQANFFSAHGSDFTEMYVGVGARRVRDIFTQASRNKPSIIFIDEIDCLGKGRKNDSNGEWQQTTNALLAEMDGFEGCDGVVVLGATNRVQDMDEALLRPGRFDRKIYVPLPDQKGRRAILSVHANGKPIQELEPTLDRLAQTTQEMSGADLANMLNEAAITCALGNRDCITLADLEESRDKVRWGKERRSMVLHSGERNLVACHEAGHAIVNVRKPLAPPLYKVSIVPRGGALGTTTLMPEEDRNIHTREFLLQQMVVLMGGRAAEKVFFGVTTNGAHGDLDSAKKLARKMVLDWGMGEKLFYHSDLQEAEREINRLLEYADQEALALIQGEKDATQRLASALLEQETLTRQQVIALLEMEPLNSAKLAAA